MSAVIARLRQAPGFWYLASPYSQYEGGIHAAFWEVSRIAGELIAGGVRVFCPISHTHPIAVAAGLDPLDVETWLAADRPMMESAHGLIVATMPGWDRSVGVREEMEFFRQADKPIILHDPPEETDARRRLRQTQVDLCATACRAIVERTELGAHKYDPDKWRDEPLAQHALRAAKHAQTAVEILHQYDRPDDSEDHMGAAICRSTMAAWSPHR